MRIPVGRDLYELIFTASPIIEDGLECAMRIDYEAKQIVIADRIPDSLRPRMVAIAINRIWQARSVPLIAAVS